MMNFDQLANLIKLGFTQEQIQNINSIMYPDTTTPTTTPTDTPTNTPTTTETPAPAPAPAPATADPAPAESETVSLLREMLGLIRKGNINTVGTQDIPQETGADVLAEILNPQQK